MKRIASRFRSGRLNNECVLKKGLCHVSFWRSTIFFYSISVSPHISTYNSYISNSRNLISCTRTFFLTQWFDWCKFLLGAFWARNFLKSPRRKCPALMVKLLRPIDFHHLSRCNSYIIALGVPTSAAGSHAMGRIKALSPCHVHIIVTTLSHGIQIPTLEHEGLRFLMLHLCICYGKLDVFPQNTIERWHTVAGKTLYTGSV